MPKQSPVSNRDRKKQNETDQQHAAARLHAGVERGGRINQEGANCCGRGHRQNVFGRVGQTSRFSVATVAADNVKRLQNHDQRNAIDQNKLEGADEKRIAAHVAHEPVEHDPEGDVTCGIEQSDDPVMIAHPGQEALPFLARQDDPFGAVLPNWWLA